VRWANAITMRMRLATKSTIAARWETGSGLSTVAPLLLGTLSQVAYLLSMVHILATVPHL
jgi:hypothetical protein